ncbi:MAG TPA: penicillin acylase family protein [Ferruginibacter sp.]|nr:penicillin acylase family protein [Ferruginibacter sp.]
MAQPFSKTETSRWALRSKHVTIIRDQYGIPHIYGKTDADAVFGLMYAQCEDDFQRVEMNYIEKLGRLSETKGEKFIYDDLLIRLLIDSTEAIRDYSASPAWMKKLLNAFADGINYYLYKNPSVKPKLLTRFEPWYPLLWTDGSIGAINTAGISVSEISHFYNGQREDPLATGEQPEEKDQAGSNGFAFAPSITESGNAILYINPHVTFYFRPEVHMVSEEGLNAYGAVTWGQFFIYQGFNEHCGWMHTSSGVDAADTYIEKLSRTEKGWSYLYDNNYRPLSEKKISIRYRADDATLSTQSFTGLFTHHGPLLAKRNGQFISLRADNRLSAGLIQCWLRTKATRFSEFKKMLDLRGNISNNTVYADAEGNIAYWHGNRVPIRDRAYNWNKPVDGSVSATEWKGLHPVSELVQSINPPNGWLQNCNSTPYTVAGINSPNKKKYPVYMAPDGENFRGVSAVRVLDEEKKYTIDKVIRAGYDTRLSAFEVLIPALIRVYERTVFDTIFPNLEEAMSILKKWDYRSGENSVATTLAVEWGERLLPAINRTAPPEGSEDIVSKTNRFAETASVHELIMPLLVVIEQLQTRFGDWRIPWGKVNRFQRISSDIDNRFDDSKPSYPVGFASSAWGMLPSYISRTFPGTKKRYGVHGNSFICAVEFGKKIKARSLLAGGESGNENSKHFFDQGLMYSTGEFKDVLFYKEDVLKHVERKYHPGE